MPTQSYKSHRRMVPMFHYVLFLIILGCLAVTGRMVIKNWDYPLRNLSILLTAMSVALLISAWYLRVFALKAQDRAIRAEENLRYFALTGKLLDKRLTVSQVIALRFASDTEFVLLADKAANENLSGDAIKKSIVNWKEDNYRV